MAFRLGWSRRSRQGSLGARLHGRNLLVKNPESEVQNLCYQATFLEGFMHRKPHSLSEKASPCAEEALPARGSNELGCSLPIKISINTACPGLRSLRGMEYAVISGNISENCLMFTSTNDERVERWWGSYD
jgi:hypothetical protein